MGSEKAFYKIKNFAFPDSLKNNGKKYLLIFKDSCEENFN